MRKDNPAAYECPIGSLHRWQRIDGLAECMNCKLKLNAEFTSDVFFEFDKLATRLRIGAHVFAALNNALANGDDPRKDSLYKIVCHLRSYDADLEDCPVVEIIPHVKAWLGEHQA